MTECKHEFVTLNISKAGRLYDTCPDCGKFLHLYPAEEDNKVFNDSIPEELKKKPAEDRNNVNDSNSFPSPSPCEKKIFRNNEATPLPPSQSPQGEIIFPPILAVPSKSHIGLTLCNSAQTRLIPETEEEEEKRLYRDAVDRRKEEREIWS